MFFSVFGYPNQSEEPDEEVYEEEVYEEPEADEEYKPATEVSFFREYDDDGYDAEAEENSIEDLAEAMARASMRREYGLGSRDSEDEPGYSTGLGDDDYADSIIGGKK